MDKGVLEKKQSLKLGSNCRPGGNSSCVPGPPPAVADVEITGPVGISALTVLITANSP